MSMRSAKCCRCGYCGGHYVRRFGTVILCVECYESATLGQRFAMKTLAEAEGKRREFAEAEAKIGVRYDEAKDVRVGWDCDLCAVPGIPGA